MTSGGGGDAVDHLPVWSHRGDREEADSLQERQQVLEDAHLLSGEEEEEPPATPTPQFVGIKHHMDDCDVRMTRMMMMMKSCCFSGRSGSSLPAEEQSGNLC